MKKVVICILFLSFGYAFFTNMLPYLRYVITYQFVEHTFSSERYAPRVVHCVTADFYLEEMGVHLKTYPNKATNTPNPPSKQTVHMYVLTYSDFDSDLYSNTEAACPSARFSFDSPALDIPSPPPRFMV
ncbi:MAG: hypothetical protein AAFW89_04875 [Bacteroidota bacterium]